MAMQKKSAAQYIRMSTDRQDLSPAIQRESIGVFADANGYEIVKSYEDQGKSGVHLSNRPSLRQLLLDAANGAPFSCILVYDVSRWGRFQDVDAAAYYEYHCRLHGVHVIYVGESFGNDLTPGSVLLKSMRRLMAAEYSRDLACKSRMGQGRVISMGFHMGPLPAFGYRRCSVSSDGKRRVVLQHGQLKLALTDRIEWVLAPPPEVQLVRRICEAYASQYLDLEQIASLVRAEGWISDKGRPVTTMTIRKLIKSEALIGNFVWGLGDNRHRIVKSNPTRRDGSVPRIIDDDTWQSVQKRLAEARLVELKRHKHPFSIQPGSSAPPTSSRVVTATDAAEAEAKQAGAREADQKDIGVPRRRAIGTPRELAGHGKEFGDDLAIVLGEAGTPAGFCSRFRVLFLWHTRVRIRLMWPIDDSNWRFVSQRAAHAAEHVLVVRMKGLYMPLDYLLLPEKVAEKHLPRTLQLRLPRALKPFHISGTSELVSSLLQVASGLA